MVAQNSLCTNITSKPTGKCKTHMTIHPGKRRHFSIYFELALALSLQALYQALAWQRGNLEVRNDVILIDLAPLEIQNAKIICEGVLFLIKFQAYDLQNNNKILLQTGFDIL